MSFRQLKMSNAVFPGGGSQTDAGVRFEWQLHPAVTINALIQDECWLIPAQKQNAQTNITGQINSPARHIGDLRPTDTKRFEPKGPDSQLGGNLRFF
jgi:hypothetical protein